MVALTPSAWAVTVSSPVVVLVVSLPSWVMVAILSFDTLHSSRAGSVYSVPSSIRINLTGMEIDELTMVRTLFHLKWISSTRASSPGSTDLGTRFSLMQAVDKSAARERRKADFKNEFIEVNSMVI